MTTDWQQAQKWEKDWWGECLNTTWEELKQIKYTSRMGIDMPGSPGSPYAFDAHGASVLDVGASAISLLLKTNNLSIKEQSTVVDPLPLPKWAVDRYITAGLKFVNKPAEKLPFADKQFDEVWIYNCLQHTQDPRAIVNEIKRVGKLIRIFEWVDTGVSAGHIHNLTELELNVWLGGEGKVEQLNEVGLKGKGYYGIFPTE